MGYNKLNPLEKEVLIKLCRGNPDVRMSECCRANDVSNPARVFKNICSIIEAMG